MKTKAEIAEFLKKKEKDDVFGFTFGAIAHYAAELICEQEYGKDRAKWPEYVRATKDSKLTKRAVTNEIVGYLPFAFKKALTHRSISAERSVDKLAAWLWVLEDPLYEFAMDEKNYAYYGVPVLKRVAKKFSVKIPNRIKDWKNGKPCQRGCIEGC